MAPKEGMKLPSRLSLNPTITQPDAKVKFLQEAAIMAQFRHPNVIQLYGIVTNGESICSHKAH